MSVPNYKTVVQSIYNAGEYDLTTKEGCGYFTRDVALILYTDHDDDFGELLKPAGRTHYVDRLGRRVAVDAILYKPTGQAIDIIGSSATPNAKPAWSEDKPRYKDSDWAVPAGNGEEKEPPPPPPPPPPDPPPPSLCPERERIAALEAALQRVEGNFALLIEGLNQNFDRFEDRLAALENPPKRNLRVTGTTSRAFGHAHSVDLIVEEK